MDVRLPQRLGLSVLALVLSVTLTACGNSKPDTVNPQRTVSTQDVEVTPNDEPSQEPVPAQESQADANDDSLQQIGSPTDDTFCVALYNGLSGSVVSLRIRAFGSTDYGNNMLPQNTSIQSNEVVRVNVPVITSDEAQAYDVLITLQTPDGDQEFELAEALANGQDYMALHQKDNTVYATSGIQEGEDAGAGNVILRD